MECKYRASSYAKSNSTTDDDFKRKRWVEDVLGFGLVGRLAIRVSKCPSFVLPASSSPVGSMSSTAVFPQALTLPFCDIHCGQSSPFAATFCLHSKHAACSSSAIRRLSQQLLLSVHDRENCIVSPDLETLVRWALDGRLGRTTDYFRYVRDALCKIQWELTCREASCAVSAVQCAQQWSRRAHCYARCLRLAYSNSRDDLVQSKCQCPRQTCLNTNHPYTPKLTEWFAAPSLHSGADSRLRSIIPKFVET